MWVSPEWLPTILHRLIDYWTCILLIFVVFICVISRWYLNIRRLPPGPVFIPFIGTIPPWIGELSGPYYTDLGRYYNSDVICFRIFGTISIVLNSYEKIKDAFNRKEISGRPEFDFFKIGDPEYNGMTFTSGYAMNKLRRFSLRVMKDLGMGKTSFEDTICQESQKSIDAFTSYQSQPFNPLALINKASSNIICEMMFGRRYDYSNERFSQSLSSLNRYIETLGEDGNIVLITKLGQKLKSKKHKEVRSLFETYAGFIREEIREVCDKGITGQYCLVHSFLEEMEEDKMGEVFNEKQLFYLVSDLIIGGSETVYTTLRWALLLMAAYPRIQTRVQEELNTVFPLGEYPSLNDKHRTPYTNAVLNEIQRYRTLVPFGIFHTCLTDVEFDGYQLPKGAIVAGNLHAVHRDVRVWKHPDTFDPENFLDDEGNVINYDRMIQFSLGRRSCLGESLARMELYIFFASWMNSFTVKMEKDDTVPDLEPARLTGINKPKAHKLRLVPRRMPSLLDGTDNIFFDHK